jgi:hypothetical protein
MMMTSHYTLRICRSNHWNSSKHYCDYRTNYSFHSVNFDLLPATDSIHRLRF